VGDGVAVVWTLPYYATTAPNVVIVNGVSLPMFPYPDPGWSYDVATQTLHAPTGAPPLAAGIPIALTVTSAWPVVAQATDPAPPSAYPMHVVVDYPDVFDAATAEALAQGELTRRQGLPRTFALRTARVGLQPGQMAVVDVPRFGLETEALVTGVRLAHASTLRDGAIWWSMAVDLVEANASRTNWLKFWEHAMKGGAAGGGTGSSVTGTIPPTPSPTPGGGAGYAIWPLGGDHDTGYPGTAFQPIANACIVTTPPSFTGRTWTIYATVKRLLGAGTFRLALTNAAGVNIATSSAASTDFASLVFTAPVTPGEVYHLRGACSDAATLFGASGYLEAVQP
jgi:hypothetical protein